MKSWLALLVFASTLCVRADGPADNIPNKVRPIPPPGIEVPAEKKVLLEAGLAELLQAINALQRKDAKTRDLLPDVIIFYRAVQDALTYHEFLKANDIDDALVLLDLGKKRAADLAEGKAPWTTQTGLVVRGFVSRLDNSVQPYGLFVPESYSGTGPRQRLDFWFHGRVEVMTEVYFLTLRMKSLDQIGVYAPRDTIVLFPYGRYCNAAKFAGEVDALEALAETQRRYRVDDERISVRGFSMGGASAWHFTVHYADRWFASNPGAGFAETPRFLDVFQNEKLNPTPWEAKLLNLYDCDKWALNILQCPTVVYSGEIDKQKQAADVMADALAARGIDMLHIVAPKTAHQVVAGPAQDVEARMESLARSGRRRNPSAVAFETYTLKYNRMNWITVDGLGEHWKHAEIHASVANPARVLVTSENVTDVTFDMAAGDCPLSLTAPIAITIDGQELKGVARPRSDRSWHASLHKEGDTWKTGLRANEAPRKRHDLQGPIDDAFLNAFVFVRPTGQAANEAAGKWSAAELERAIEHWRRQFRGYAIVKDDTAITAEDIASKNLILWGDTSSNTILKKIADQLPIRWDAKSIIVGKNTYDAATHAPILIYPNPLNPARYVVVNSSFTYREFHYLNNARQVPMLPDWAIVDLREPPNTIHPGKIEAADFFDENWRLK